MRIYKISIVLSLLVILSPATLIGDNDLPQGFKLVADNGTLRLFANGHNSQIVLEDLRTGKLWRSNPDLVGANVPNDYWKRQTQSVFLLRSWGVKTKLDQLIDSDSGGYDLKQREIEDGVVFTYLFREIKIRFSIEYRIEGDALEVTIPSVEIDEAGDHRLLTIDLLPFFGATTAERRGYALIPDGSGAISTFREGHPDYYNNFSQGVYGQDSYSFSRDLVNDGRILMPIFGLVDEGDAFLAIITGGDFNSRIKFSPSGYIVGFNRASAEFLFRRTFVDFYRQKRIKESYDPIDRSVRYLFLVNDEADYSGMAKAYRHYLMEEKGVLPLRERRNLPALLNLRLFMGIKKKALFFDQFAAITTFSEARTILQGFKERGVESIDLTLVGWNRGGYDGAYPTRLPPEGGLGGKRGLVELGRYAKDNGINLYLEDNYLDDFRFSRDFSNKDIIRDDRRSPLRNGGDHFLLSPEVAYHKFAARDIPRLKDYGVKGLEFRHFGSVLISDNNELHPLGRREFAGYWMQILSLSREQLGEAAVQGGNIYTLPYVDRMFNIPMRASRLLFEDEEVPFYQMVVHGLVAYSADPANLRSDHRYQFLKDIEYGAIPVYELTYRRPNQLKDSAYGHLFSSYYVDWIDTIATEYKELSDRIGHLTTQFMIDHRKLAENVYQTTYEDGTRIIVNYGEDEYRVGELAVGSLDYAVVRPGS